MSRLTDLELCSIYSKAFSEKSSEGIVTTGVAALRAIESAATEPLLQRIAKLEQCNSDLHEDVQRFKKHALNEKAARLELERQLEEARSQELEEAAQMVDASAVAAAAATERELCAKLCDTLAKDCTDINARLAYRYAASAIRGIKG